ncbi:polysaccharide deacetylase [Malaciobacter marinus]|uniref:Polysaccharide deacetylase n=1 Tax=Malaciobacter marinus TaxID=505249 RepID=A0A347TPD4_9BACT|nr:polysaccharide deacetylase family protein [Malaciobacter marinus]AXX88462.1 polysaccharide deacetylase [Malaciobacter marinus]PHO12113.1 polysaccharide deacetylase [Malaciobacter marinus]PHO16613.1 polysaccharide deacetylase [Malaciobacter marinus]
MKYLLLLIISYYYLSANAHVFVYHRFGDSKHASTNTTLKELEKEFTYFKDNGYEVVKLSQIIEKVKNKEEIPDNWVALTIDDSYKSFYKNGLPIFKKYNYPFSLYVYVEATQKGYGDFMTWDELKDASKYGEIGLHSYSHPHLTKISKQKVFNDTKKSFEVFEEKLGFKPKSYAYPYGEYNEQIKNTLKEFKFDYILNQSIGTINKNSDVYDINRIALVGKVNLEQKLRYKTLEAQWLEPLKYPKDGVLKRVHARVDSKIKTIKLYITGFGWQDVKVNNGIIDVKLDLKLKNSRTRVILSPDYFTVANKIIIKD